MGSFAGLILVRWGMIILGLILIYQYDHYINTSITKKMLLIIYLLGSNIGLALIFLPDLPPQPLFSWKVGIGSAMMWFFLWSEGQGKLNTDFS